VSPRHRSVLAAETAVGLNLAIAALKRFEVYFCFSGFPRIGHVCYSHGCGRVGREGVRGAQSGRPEMHSAMWLQAAWGGAGVGICN